MNFLTQIIVSTTALSTNEERLHAAIEHMINNLFSYTPGESNFFEWVVREMIGEII